MTVVGQGLPAVAVQLVAMPGVWRRLLEVHVPDRLGRCAGCPTAGGSGTRWPCTLHAVASEARRLDAPDGDPAQDGSGPPGSAPGGAGRAAAPGA